VIPSTDKRIPVLVVSGFLGSGKTTLVGHLLRAAQASRQRAAVISNEFGALGIDRALLGGEEAAYVEIEGGCVCCQLSDALLDTLHLLRERVQPDCIIVETSGLALPFDTQLQLWREPVCHWVEDDLAVVVVNAEQLLEGRDLEGTFEDQVSSADLLLLNKIDLVPAQALTQLEASLHAMAPDRPVVRAVHGQVDPVLLFPPVADRRRVRRRSMHPAGAPHQHESFTAEEVSVAHGIAPAILLEQLGRLGALRLKGFVQTAQGLRLVQGVGRRIELKEVPASPPQALIGRVVVIARRRRAGDEPGPL
jgi:cobalamin biosynthesis protein CobW